MALTSTMTKNRNLFVVTAEAIDIFFDPFQCEQLILESHVTGVLVGAQRKKTKDSKAIVERHLIDFFFINGNKKKDNADYTYNHNILIDQKIWSEEIVISRSFQETSSMNENHYGQFFILIHICIQK